MTTTDTPRTDADLTDAKKLLDDASLLSRTFESTTSDGRRLARIIQSLGLAVDHIVKHLETK
jgi:hypothetical protein